MENSRTEKAYSLQIYQLIRYGAFILTSLFLAKSNIGLTAIGLYELFLLVAGTLIFLVSGFLLHHLATPSLNIHKTHQQVVVFNAFILLCFFGALGAFVVFLFGKPITANLLDNNAIQLPLILGGYIFFSTPAMLIEHIYSINHRSKSILVYGIFSFIIQLVAVGIPLYMGLGLSGLLIGLLLVSIIQFVWLLSVLGNYAKAVFDWPLLIGFFKVKSLGWLPSFLNSSVVFVDGFILISMFSTDDLAIFKFGAHELPLVLLWVNSLHVYISQRFVNSKTDSPFAELRAETSRLNWTLLPIAMVLLFTSHWFYPRVFNPFFEPSATIFNIYLLLIIGRLLFPHTILAAKGFDGTLTRASLFGFSINVVSSLFLAQSLGIVGVAYGTLIAFLCEKIYLVVACKRLLKIDFEKYTPSRLYYVFSLLTAAIFVLLEFILY